MLHTFWGAAHATGTVWWIIRVVLKLWPVNSSQLFHCKMFMCQSWYLPQLINAVVLLILLSALYDPVQYRYHLTSSELGTDIDVMDDASEWERLFHFLRRYIRCSQWGYNRYSILKVQSQWGKKTLHIRAMSGFIGQEHENLAVSPSLSASSMSIQPRVFLQLRFFSHNAALSTDIAE